MTKNSIGNTVLAALVLASTFGAAQAQIPAYDAMWSAVGSAGMVQDGTTATAKTYRAVLSPGTTGKVVARFPVAPSADLAEASGVLHLIANLRDAGSGASITVSLFEVAVGAPGESAFRPVKPILTVNSTDVSSGAYVNNCVNDDGALRLDFESNVYYIEAQMDWDKAAQLTSPALRAIQLAVYPDKMCGL